MTDQSQPNEAISFRSKTLAGVVFFGSISLAAFLAVLLFPVSNKEAGAAFALLMLAPCFLMLLEPGRGSFRLDSEGIHQAAFLRKPRYLRWQDVERVQWRWDTACFEGKDTRISIRWTMTRKGDTARARAFLVSVLSPQFDLAVKPIRQWSFEPNFRSAFVFVCKLVAASTLGAGIFVAGFVGSLFLNQPLRYRLGLAWFMLFLAGCFGILTAVARKEKRMSEQINPTWRLRRKQESPT